VVPVCGQHERRLHGAARLEATGSTSSTRISPLRRGRSANVLAACATSAGQCALTETKSADAAPRTKLADGCEVHFFTYLDKLLEVAEQDPGAAQKERFSEFLVWRADTGVISRLQAQEGRRLLAQT
jgi:hypothetical protein